MAHNFDSFPVLHTPRLSLIEIGQGQRAGLFHLFSNPAVTEYYHVIPMQVEEDLQKMIDFLKKGYSEKKCIRWAITPQGGDSTIGTIGFSSFTTGHKGAIVFALEPAWQGKGLITEAANEVIKFGFAELGLKRIEAEVMPGNKPSEKVLGKLGFQHEGLLRQWSSWQGKQYDMNMYSLLAADYNK